MVAYGFTIWGDEKFWNWIVVMLARRCVCTYCHRITHFKNVLGSADFTTARQSAGLCPSPDRRVVMLWPVQVYSSDALASSSTSRCSLENCPDLEAD